MARKVLIIEDSATDAAIVKDLLQKEGLKVEIAVSGKEGIEKAVASHPDLIVLDLILPDVSGFDVCARLKKEASLHDAIVVVLSVKDNINDITKAFHVGADDYIIKPPLPELLIRKIKLYLGMR
ncbi:MAG: response regulator [bacterium]|nr:response regulator [bacterium]